MRLEEHRRECATDTQHIVNLSAYRWAMNMLGDLKSSRVLDAACGAGYGSFELAHAARWVVGVDRDPSAIDEARSLYRHRNLRLLPMDCESLALKDASVDVVVSFETIEHVENDRQFLREVYRVLKPRGRLVLSTPQNKVRGATPTTQLHVREYVWDELGALLAEYFSSVRLFGRRLSPRLAALEANLDEVRHFDPWRLRRLVPRKLRHRLGSLLSRTRGGIRLEETKPEDVEYSEGLTATSTLLAICRKGV